MRRLPGNDRAHGRAGEPGHYDGQVEGTPPQPNMPNMLAQQHAARPATLLLTQSTHLDRSRRCSMLLMGSRATSERRTASTRFVFPMPSTWCVAPPAFSGSPEMRAAGCMRANCRHSSRVAQSVSPSEKDRAVGVHPLISNHRGGPGWRCRAESYLSRGTLRRNGCARLRSSTAASACSLSPASSSLTCARCRA